MTRQITIELDVNPDTEEMEGEALHCRSFGHVWKVYEPPKSEQMKQLAEGLITYDRECINQCGCTWSTTYSVPDFKPVRDKRSYQGGYLMPAGKGRLARADALAARFARQYPTLLAA